MQPQDSYSDFMPLRQSSMLTDETLLMNETDVYADVTVVWATGHQARELELERARIELEAIRNGVPYVTVCDSILEDTLLNDSTKLHEDDANEETIWMSALDIPFSPDATENANDESMFNAYHTVLDYTISPNKAVKNASEDKMNTSLDRQSLNDTLPMDDEDCPFDDTWISSESV